MNYFNPFAKTLVVTGTWTSERADEGSRFWEILLMYFILMLSGNPYCVQNYNFLVIASVIIPLGYFMTNAYRKIHFNTVYIFTFLLGYELMHAAVYQLDYSLTFFKLFLVLLLAFASVQILGNRFITVFTDTMCIIALLSFVFTILCYIPSLKWKMYDLALRLFPMNDGFKAYKTPTLLLYTLHPQYYLGEFNYVRNAGIFWESGAFAVFLNLTLYLRYISRPIRKVRDLFDTKSVILIVAVLTTTSTMGFLALIFLLFFFSFKLKSIFKFVLVILVGAFSYFAYTSVDFLGEKISTQLEESDVRNNRFGAAIMDWDDIRKRPLIGSSRRIEVIFGNVEMSNQIRRPNGLTNFIRDYGLIYFAFYFTLVYISFRRINNFHNHHSKTSVVAFGIVLLWVMSFSELIFDLPFFKMLIFLSAVYIESASTKQIPQVGEYVTNA